MSNGHSQDAVWRERLRDRAAVRLLMALPQGVVLIAFLLLLVVAPLPLGGNRDWAWAPMAVAVGVIAVACMVTTFNSQAWRVAVDERGPLLALIVCFGLMTAVALAQMTTLSASAGAAQYYAKATEILGRAHAEVASLAVDASRNTLLKSVACGLIFLVARVLFSETRRARLLLAALGLSGVLVAGYSIFLAASTNFCFVGGFLKKQTEFEQHDHCMMSGTFVSSNNFGCFCGMALAAMIGLMFVERRRRPAHDDEEDERGAGARFLVWMSGGRLVLMALAFLFLGCLMISGSRAGFAATIAGLMALFFLMLRERLKTRGQLGRAFMLGIAIAAVIGLVAGGSMIRKISYFQRADSADRLIIWQAAVDAIRGSPVWGWGLGSFADIYAVYQPKQIIQPNDKAHSTPLETVVELGIPGAVPAWLVVLIPWVVCLRGAWRRRRRHRYLPAAAFAISGIAILHSMVDFSLQIPAIAFLVSAFLGMGWAQSFSRSEPPAWAFTADHE
jgi:O-antigen ligase/polysaccharide polymerase Wzy-like membrane protein